CTPRSTLFPYTTLFRSEAGGKALGVELNVTSKESNEAMVEKVLQTFGRIDILVNNAGISQKVTVEDMTYEDINRVFNVNMFGLRSEEHTSELQSRSDLV